MLQIIMEKSAKFSTVKVLVLSLLAILYVLNFLEET